MSTSVLFVSINNTFNPEYSIAQLEPAVERAWAISATRAAQCDHVVAVVAGEPVAAWRLRGAYPTDETYSLSNGDRRPRVGLSLGEPLPILPKYRQVPALRRGVCAVQLP